MSTGVLEVQQNGEMMANPGNLIMNIEGMQHMMNVATFMAGGTLTLPEPYRKNPANCLAVVMQAAQWNMNPFAVAQKTHFVNGNIGYEAQLVAAVINDSKAVKGSFHFEWFGDWSKVIGKFEVKKSDKGEYRVPAWSLKDEEGLGIKVWATLKGEDEPRVLELLLAQARTRNSTLWADDPRQQLAYLGQKRWSRLYAPGVILGVYTPDEIEQFESKEINPMPDKPAATNEPKGNVIDPAVEEHRNRLIASLEAVAKNGHAALLVEWRSMSKKNRADTHLVGMPEFERLEAIALDADSAKPAATNFNPASQTVDHIPGADVDEKPDPAFVADLEKAESK